MCGDVDILITNDKKIKKTDTQIIEDLIDALTRDGYLVERLGANRIAKTGSITYMGIFKLSPKDKCRHIDIKIYPKNQYPYGILYFTGSAQFNKIMRKVANDNLFTMSDAGIKRLPTGSTPSSQKIYKQL